MSFLWEQPVEITGSAHNPLLEVTYAQGRLKLSTGNAVYSFEDNYVAFREGLRLAEIEKLTIKDCLILGYGMGSIPVILEKLFKLTPSYTGVELDETIVELARKYYHERSEHINFQVEDAYEWVRSENGVYDLICIDLFIDNEVPEKFEQEEFLLNVKGLLKEGGMLLFNRMALGHEQLEKANHFYNNSFSKLFDGSRMLRVRNNRLLCWQND